MRHGSKCPYGAAMRAGYACLAPASRPEGFSMKTRCPDCSTSFDVTPAQLSARNGKVRCGVCATVFNAFDHAVAEEPDFPVLHAGSPDAAESVEPATQRPQYQQSVRTAGSG